MNAMEPKLTRSTYSGTAANGTIFANPTCTNLKYTKQKSAAMESANRHLTTYYADRALDSAAFALEMTDYCGLHTIYSTMTAYSTKHIMSVASVEENYIPALTTHNI